MCPDESGASWRFVCRERGVATGEQNLERMDFKGSSQTPHVVYVIFEGFQPVIKLRSKHIIGDTFSRATECIL